MTQKVVPVALLDQIEVMAETAGKNGIEARYEDGTPTPNGRLLLQIAAQVRAILAAPVADGRADVLEEAAKICERVDFEGTHDHAAAIRAAKEK